MSAADWATPVLAFVGAGLGSVAAYGAARKATRQLETQGRREEWGRRFTAALGYLSDADPRNRDLGRVILSSLGRSELASEEESQLAGEVLTAAIYYGAGGVNVEAVTGGGSVDEIEFVEDDEDSEGEQP
jgi:hypothetical protein